MEGRSRASIHLGDAGWAGYKGYFFLLLTGYIIVAEHATFNESVIPFRDRRVWEHLGLTWNEPLQEKSFAFIPPQAELLLSHQLISDAPRGSAKVHKEREPGLSPAVLFKLSENLT